MNEQLLFILFILFSVVSALLERRKRKRAREEAQRREAGQSLPVEDELEEEDDGQPQWPFPMGGDPFEPPRRRQEPRRATPGEEVGEAVPDPAEGDTIDGSPQGGSAAETPPPRLLEQLERAMEIDRQARAVEVQAKESAAQLPQVQPRRRVQELVRDQIRGEEPPPAAKGKKSRWHLTPASARDAIVYAEILGPPKAERGEEYR